MNIIRWIVAACVIITTYLFVNHALANGREGPPFGLNDEISIRFVCTNEQSADLLTAELVSKHQTRQGIGQTLNMLRATQQCGSINPSPGIVHAISGPYVDFEDDVFYVVVVKHPDRLDGPEFYAIVFLPGEEV